MLIEVHKILYINYTRETYKKDFSLTILDYIKSHSSKPVYELVQGGLTYLDTRTEFWRQQKPLYARKKDIGKSASGRKKKVKISQGKQVLKQLEEVDQGGYCVYGTVADPQSLQNCRRKGV